ncbi:MAG: 50S ribosomal protein L25/general stress protein Ctc [Gammaproteobacteria bacterium]|jgi:large subunit ribosomal protein L25
MSNEFIINAQPRDDQGKGASRRLRREGLVPGILYGAGKEPTPIAVAQNELAHQLENDAFYSHILTVKIGKATEKAVLRDLQRHPSHPTILHFDLQRVSEDSAVRVHVPLHFINEDKAPGVKQQGGVVSHHLVEVEIASLPKDLPESIEVDLGGLNVGDAIHLSELKLPKGVEIVELSHGDEHDNAVVSIHHARVTAAEEPEAGEAAAEGEEPAGESE